MADQFEREIAGALRDAINHHGPIDKEQIGSASKRIASTIREALKRERDLIHRSQPKDAKKEP